MQRNHPHHPPPFAAPVPRHAGAAAAAAAAGAAPASGTTWFQGAPVTKLWAMGTVGAILYLRSQHNNKSPPYYAFHKQHDPHHSAPWWQFDASLLSQQPLRYLTSKWLFWGRHVTSYGAASTDHGSTNRMGTWIMGTLLLVYWMRALERQMGSRQFLALFLCVLAMSVTCEWLLHLALLVYLDVWKYTGPYAWLGALAAWFHQYVPRQHPRFVQILQFAASEKVFGYALYAYIATSEGWHSVAASAEGFLAWFVFDRWIQPHPAITRALIPDFLVTRIAPWAAALLEAPPPIWHAAVGAGGMAPRHPQQPAARMAPPPPPPAPVEPDPLMTEQLVHMGFPRSDVMEALRVTNNSLERAADRLLAQAATASATS